ncbi:hypothetical protein QBC35DRAFT_222004 [Podospora australis]|uniref:Uncharacterized protein n=1 Tax=Podospora australis TaxID=1536484 RepID=A0AAN6X2G5_9PEZI|nr:hypothetical protein QBC35DRAFT_222004 [Podospora australis]
MARKLLSALALTQAASAVLEGFVEIVYPVDVTLPQFDGAFVPMAAQAAAVDDPECAPAASRVRGCNDAGYADENVPFATLLSCLCCRSGTTFLPAYSTCASYLFNEATGNAASSLGPAMVTFYSACSREGSGLCAPSTTRLATITGAFLETSTTRTGTSRRSTITSMPRACSSVASKVNSCSGELGAGTRRVPESEAAECLCEDTFGTYNTALDDWASSCAPWARTMATEDYVVISRLRSICEDYPPGRSTRAPSPAASGGLGGIVFTPVTGNGDDATATPAPTGDKNSAPPNAAGSQTLENPPPQPSSAQSWAKPAFSWLVICVVSAVSFSVSG